MTIPLIAGALAFSNAWLLALGSFLAGYAALEIWNELASRRRWKRRR